VSARSFSIILIFVETVEDLYGSALCGSGLIKSGLADNFNELKSAARDFAKNPRPDFVAV